MVIFHSYVKLPEGKPHRKRTASRVYSCYHLLGAAMQQHFQLLVACQLRFPFRKWADVAMSVAYTQHQPTFAPEPTMGSTKLLLLNAENMFEW